MTAVLIVLLVYAVLIALVVAKRARAQRDEALFEAAHLQERLRHTETRARLAEGARRLERRAVTR